MHLDRITPLILTFNEEANIARTLGGLAWASRIVVVDSYSTDRTLDILAADPRVDLIQRPFDGFASQCNAGLEHVETEWVLSIDADYVCPPELAAEIRGLPDDPDEDGFQARFRYCIDGRPLRGSLYPPRTVLYRRARAHYVADGHAHRVQVQGPLGRLKTRIHHDDRKPLSVWFDAQQKYTSQEAAKLLCTPRHELGLKDRLRLTGWAGPLLTPLYCLILKGGILDGRAGLVYALQRTYAEIALALALHEERGRAAGEAAPASPVHAALRRAQAPLSASLRTAHPSRPSVPVGG